MTLLANFFAKYSVNRWNPLRPLRILCRFCYQGMGGVSILVQPFLWKSPYAAPPTFPTPRKAICNTYPWPYKDHDFAPWEENDTPGAYTLVPDPAGFVIRHCTSYCAWKLHELHGHWPKRPPHGTFHSKNWQVYLTKNGYVQAFSSPANSPEDHYIGIDPAAGEFGQLYWFELYIPAHNDPATASSPPHYHPALTYCSTYIDHQFVVVQLKDPQVKRLTWIRVG